MFLLLLWILPTSVFSLSLVLNQVKDLSTVLNWVRSQCQMSLAKPAQGNKFSAKLWKKDCYFFFYCFFFTVMKSLLCKYMMINIIPIPPKWKYLHSHSFICLFGGKSGPFLFWTCMYVLVNSCPFVLWVVIAKDWPGFKSQWIR